MESTEVTQLLGRVAQGDKASENRLLEVAYSELKRLAIQAMRRELKDHTPQPSALVNEAYCRLAGTQRIPGKVAATFTPPPPKRPNAAAQTRKNGMDRRPAPSRKQCGNFLALDQA